MFKTGVCRTADPMIPFTNVFQGRSEMDKSLSPHPQEIMDSKKLCRDGALMFEQPFTEDMTSPYGKSLLLNDVTYLHPGLCRTMRQIKTETQQLLMDGAYQGSGLPTTLPEYPDVCNAADTTCANFFIKQEMVNFPDVSLFQLLNTDSEQLVHASHLSLPLGNSHIGSVQNSSKPTNGPQNECFPQVDHLHRSVCLPPSPPNSEPSSPSKSIAHSLSPPPSYEASIASKLHFHTHDPIDPGETLSLALIQGPDQNSSVGLVQTQCPAPIHPTPLHTTPRVGPQSPVLAQSAPFKSNRRNNPDLERRRIHHCNVPGES